MKLFELFATLALDTNDFATKVNQTGKQASSFASTVQNKMSAATVAMGNLIARGVETAAQSVVKLTQSSLNALREYEQNLGGSEAVFGEWATTVQSYSQTAFKNMGLSMSDYLSTANKMGSLFKGAGFETSQAMDMTAQAMQRAADVASIMGVDATWAMESIAGLAKGNFTMMDNLGVAINDTTLANYALEKGIRKSIRTMTTQEKIGLALELFMERTAEYAGNYAKENTTLAGSYEVLSAAWTNMLVGAEGSVDDLLWAAENAAKVTLNNLGQIIPRLGQSLWKAVQQAAPKIRTAFVSLWNNDLPGIATKGANLIISAINTFFGTNFPAISKINLPKWSEVEAIAKEWWGNVKSLFQFFGNIALKVVGANSAEEAIGKIKKAWDDVVFVITNADSIIDDFLGFDLSEAWTGAMQQIIDWWGESGIAGAVQTAIDKVKEFLGLDGTKAFDVQFNYHVNATQEVPENVKKAVEEATGSDFLGQAAETVVTQSTYNPDAPGIGQAVDAFFDLFKPKATGLRYVPYNNFPARLHEGEAVLTKAEATEWRKGGTNTVATLDPDDFAAAVARAVSGLTVTMDGVTVGRLTAPTVSREIAASSKARRYT